MKNKDFNLKRALSGEGVSTFNGHKIVSISINEKEISDHNVKATDDRGITKLYTKKGKWKLHASNYDLIMTDESESSSVYTQAMCDDGELPSVGMHVLYGEHKKIFNVMLGVDKDNVLILSPVDSDEWYNAKVQFVRPLVSPITLIDGEAYQFNYNNGSSGMQDALMRYRSNGDYFYFDSTIFKREYCTNIKHLTV